MNDSRPNPDELLSRVQAEAARQSRGKLRIFFGYAAGVGKTFAMLTEARQQQAAGVDVVAGYVEPHGRQETESMLAGIETIPFKMMTYRGKQLREFDLDAALARRPQLILVDELAHTNAEGLRHAKRYQDVEELLAAGIDVYSTLNVQHIESLNDVVAQITGVVVRETLPDAVFDRADEIELIDITPEQLVQRLKAGKVYLPVQAQRAIQSFFQRANLVALREISLRRSADRVNADVQSERTSRGDDAPWATNERLLVCVSASPQSARLIRGAKRLAASLRAEWIAVSVETPGALRAGAATQQRLIENLRLAEQLGARTTTLSGNDPAAEIANYARAQNVTKIIAGKTEVPRWRAMLFGLFLDQLLRQSGEIDVYVIRGQGQVTPAATVLPAAPFDWRPYGWTSLIVAACAGIAVAMFQAGLAEANLVMTLLLGVVAAAAWFGRGPGIYASVVSVLVFDFCFVPPYLTFAVSDIEYVITFGVMLAIAVATSSLTSRIREQVTAARERQRRTEALYRLSRQLAAVSGSDFLVGLAGKQIAELVGGEVVIYLPDEDRRLQVRLGHKTMIAQNANSAGVAQWVLEHEQTAGAGTETLPQAAAMFMPLTGTQSTVGVLAVCPADSNLLRLPEQKHVLETCASQVALALERDELAIEASQVLMQAETERLRSSLLSSVSHDLRTPLAAIAGASSSLLNAHSTTDSAAHRDLLQSIFDESHRLSRLVDNLLEMTKIEAGGVTVNKQWEVVEEIVGSALQHVEATLGKRKVVTEIPANLPLVSMDGLLIEQVLLNLLDNALKYTPPDSPLEIRVAHDQRTLTIAVCDRGPGLSPGEERRIFAKFYRGKTHHEHSSPRGSGLGLAICDAIVGAHGGTIWAENREQGGARFVFTLPLEGRPPTVEEIQNTERVAAE